MVFYHLGTTWEVTLKGVGHVKHDVKLGLGGVTSPISLSLKWRDIAEFASIQMVLLVFL